jgi:hypothetical protein
VRWVELRSYVGPDRRRFKTFRLMERRKADLSVRVPAIQVLLRQLHLRVLDVATAREALARFHLRLSVASAVAHEGGQSEAAVHLSSIERKLAECADDGGMTAKHADEVQELTANALCALR